jgi:hypothetical protein
MDTALHDLTRKMNNRVLVAMKQPQYCRRLIVAVGLAGYVVSSAVNHSHAGGLSRLSPIRAISEMLIQL